jgi:hypothetical protein
VAAAGLANSEVEVWRIRRALARRPDGPQALTGRDVSARADGEHRQVQIGGVEAVARAHAHGQTRRPGRAGEPHLAGRGGHDRRSERRSDVDPSMLSRRVWVRSVAELGDHLAVDRPQPGHTGGAGGGGLRR